MIAKPIFNAETPYIGIFSLDFRSVSCRSYLLRTTNRPAEI